jgi:exosortase E/protease (VPEID-CTERM system)
VSVPNPGYPLSFPNAAKPLTKSGSYLALRITYLACLFITELLAITTWLDTSSLSNASIVTVLIGSWGSWILQVIIASSGLYVAVRYLSHGAPQMALQTSAKPPIAWRLLAAHWGVMAIFCYLSSKLFGGGLHGDQNGAIAVAWLAAGLLAIVLAATSLIPAAHWLLLFRGTAKIWFCAVGVAVLACVIGSAGHVFWIPAASTTFTLVRILLSLFLPHVDADPAARSIGTPAFHVEIAPACSGLEGMGLMLVFTAAWLWLFRKEFRFPHALLLIPAGLATMFVLNVARIAALILIGNAGAASVAAGGFHSQAGWIAFTAVALAFPVVAGRISWIGAAQGARPQAEAAQENPTARYVLPFLAILAAAMISRAFSGPFEWLYPLRFLAAAAVLWSFRRQYADLDWRFGWFAAFIGAAVFAMWMAMERLTPVTASTGISAGLAALPAQAGIVWLTFRVLAAVVTAPAAEELAFRDFLPRRLMSANFECIGLRNIPMIPLLISSVAFGMMHGARWFAGAVAGLLYGWALRRRGRIGDAVAAHAVTNALLAAWVLWHGEWSLW